MPRITTPSIASRLVPELPRLGAGAACLLGTNALALAIPALLERAIDALGAAGPSALPETAHAAAWIGVLALAQAAIRTASRSLIFNVGRNIEFSLRQDLFARLLREPPSFYQRHPTGDLMSRLTSDLGAVRMLFGAGVLNLLNTAVVYGAGLWLMWALSPRLTIAAAVPLPLVVFFGRLSSRTLYRTSHEVQDQIGRLATAVQEDLAGLSVVRAFAIEPLRERRFAAQSRGLLVKSLALARARGLLAPVFAMLGGIGTLIVMWLGGREVIAGRMTLGSLVAFSAYLAALAWPTAALGWVLALWQRGAAAWSRVSVLLADTADAGPAAPVPSAGLVADAGHGDASLSIRHLTLDRDGRRVLDDVSLDVPPGHTVALVGRLGGGKSTIADALLGFVDLPPGTVFVGGRDARTLSPRQLRAGIAYAPQDAFLFSATIADNVAFGRRGEAARSDRPAIDAAARAAGLARDLAAFPLGMDTLVGERGITLSGGQRQRVALARALYAGGRILVLDDALSSVDGETEQEILGHLGPMLGGRTVVMVSHRVAAVRHADEIVVLDRGRVVERGTHDALAAAGGIYASLYREQLFDLGPSTAGDAP